MTVTVESARASTRKHQLAPVIRGDQETLQFLPGELAGQARKTIALRKFEGRPGQTLLLAFGDRQCLLTGLGDPGELTFPQFQEAIGKGFLQLSEAGADKMDLLLPAGLGWEIPAMARLAAEAVSMAGYTFTGYRTLAEKPPRREVRLVPPETPSAKETKALNRAIALAGCVADGIRLARDLINHPAEVAHPGYVAAEARRVAKAAGAKFREIGGEALKRAGFHAIHAVGRAGEHAPRLVALEYGRRRKNVPTLALVGKGVTFDSGGLDIKSASGMALMKKDMGGAAIVLGAFLAIAAQKTPIHLICVLGLAENAVDSRAYRPGDILRTKHGLTVEVTNTDAEGRLVLADAMALAHRYKPGVMIDFATLTGACRVALGREIMGLFCDHVQLRDSLMALGESTGDHLWPLPLWAPYQRMLKSEVADMVNAPSEGVAGAITAALFLKAFAGDVAWAHIDCYGWSDGHASLFPKGGSGAGVRLCAQYATQLLEDTAHVSG